MNDQNINIISENAVIGSLLLDNGALDDVSFLQPEDFESRLHRNLYQAICELVKDGKTADMISVAEHLAPHDNEFFVKVCDIANSSYTSSNVRYYADIVRKHGQQRKVLSACQAIIQRVHEQKEDILDFAHQVIDEISDSSHFDMVPAKDILPVVLQRIDERQNNPSDISGLSIGFNEIDRITHGLHPGHLIILAARPSMGKTLLAMNVAEHVAIKEKKTVALFSLEMNKEELMERSLASLGGVDENFIKSGKLAKDDFDKISALVPEYSNAKLFVEDCPSLNVSDIRSRCRRIKREHGLSMVIVDYLTLVDGKGENETDRIGKISRAFKLLARDLNVPILVVSQLNRGVEQRQDKRPTMADLRQSGAIEQDADLILFIYRDEVYNKDSQHRGLAEINIAKNRHGSLGTVFLTFNGNHCRFDNCGSVMPIHKPVKKPAKNHFYDRINPD